MKKYKVEILEKEETFFPAYFEAEEFIQGFNVTLRIIHAGSAPRVKYIENVTAKELRKLEKGKAEVIQSPFGGDGIVILL